VNLCKALAEEGSGSNTGGKMTAEEEGESKKLDLDRNCLIRSNRKGL
jgi:hypothetical protein